MNNLFQAKLAHLLKWSLCSFGILFQLNFAHAQTFYQTYTSPKIATNKATAAASANGYSISSSAWTIDGFQFTEIETDGSGNKLSDDQITIPNTNNEERGLSLSDGTYVTAAKSANGAAENNNTFTQFDANGNAVNTFELVFPADAAILSPPCMMELPNGNLYIVGGYSEDNPTGPPEMRHFVYAEYDLTNQQFVFENDLLWSTSSIEANCVGIKMAGDGKLIFYVYDEAFNNKHLIIKKELDGTQLWQVTASTLERPVTDFAPSPEGGVWVWTSFFNNVFYYNPDGSFGASFNLSDFQNGISGPAEVKGIVATNDNGVLIAGTADPGFTGNSQTFTALVSNTGTTLESHFLDLPTPLPTRLDGTQLNGGGFALAGGLNTGGDRTPFLLVLDESGNLETQPTFIDLDISLSGSTANPDIWSLHTVTLDIVNDGTETATGVRVHIPQTTGSVYQGGNAYTSTQGTFEPFGSNEWNVGSLAAGASASVTINYFRTSSDEFFQYAQVVAADQTDFDSEPNNGNGTDENEDDESTYGNASVDFYLDRISAPIEAVAVGGDLEFSYIHGAFYPLNGFDLSVTTNFYLSLDGEVSSDDIFLTSDVTNFTGGTQQFNKTLTIQIPSSISPGDYKLLGFIDAPEDFTEPNEANNKITFPSNYENIIITPPTGGLPDLIGSRPFVSSPIGGYDSGDNISGGSFDLYNTGAATSGTIQIAWYLSTDQTFDANDIFLNERDFEPTQILHFSPQFTSNPSLVVPDGIAGGEYWVLVFVDSNEAISESTESNNVQSSIQRITINGSGGGPCSPDVTDPIINGCPNNIALSTSGSSMVATWTTPTVTDNCTASPTLTSNFNSGASFPIGSTIVSYVATDAAGNTSECSFTVTVTSSGPSGCSNSLLTNGGFENGLDGWNNRGGGTITTNAYAGNNALQICAQGESRVIQSTPVEGGKTYTLEFFGSNDLPPLNFTGSATVKFLTDTWQPLPISVYLAIPSDWTLISQNFVAPPNAAYAEINFQAPSNACIFIDEVCFSESGSGPVDCVLTIDVTNITCSDNGTPFDAADDTYSYDYVVNSTGNCGSGWETSLGGNTTGLYGATNSIGPLNIAAGSVVITVRDLANSGSIASTTVTPPAPCSNGGNNLPDLSLSDFNAPASGQVGSVINYNFDLQNIGVGDANGSFSIKAYFSTDNVLSTDDIFDGLVPTGNLAAGATVPNVPGASTIPALAAGDYFLILKVDADDQIDESNENNNVISSAIAITVGGGGTPNCDADSDFPWHDWISNVSIGTALDQSSGKSTYSDFTGTPFSLTVGNANAISLTATYSYFTHDEYWRVWIDLNQNDIFEADEIVYNTILQAPANGTPSATATGNFTLPATATTGNAKMRVIMRRDAYADPCGSIDFGEVEDYMVNILSNGPNNRKTSSELEIQSDIKFFPNPATNGVSVELGNRAERAEEVILVDQLGKVVFVQRLEATALVKTLFIDLADFSDGTYFLQVKGQKMKPVTKLLMIQKGK